MKGVESKMTVLQDANYLAAAAAQKAKADAHSANVRAAAAESKRAARQRNNQRAGK